MQISFFFKYINITIFWKLIKKVLGTSAQDVLRKLLQKVRLYNLINNLLDHIEAVRLSTTGSLNIGILNQVEKVIKLIKVPQAIIDCGVGRLNTEAWFFKKFYPNCKIIGLECYPKRYKKLKKLFPGILLKAGVDEKISEEYGYIGGKQDQFKFGLEKEDRITGKNNHKKIKINTLTIDYIDEKFGPFDSFFIWADIEGTELRLLKGATKSLSSKKIVGLNFELYPRNPQKIWSHYTGIRCSADQVINYLKNFNYKITGKLSKKLLNEDPSFESKEWKGDFIFLPN